MNWKNIKKSSIYLYIGYLIVSLIIFIFQRTIMFIFPKVEINTTGNIIIGAVGGVLSIIVVPFIIGYLYKNESKSLAIISGITVIGSIVIWHIINHLANLLFRISNSFAQFILELFAPEHTASFTRTFCLKYLFLLGIGGKGFCIFKILGGIPTLILVIAMTYGSMELGKYVASKK